VIKPSSSITLVNDIYEKRSVSEAKADLAAGKKVIAIFLALILDGTREPIRAYSHSAVMTSLVLTSDGAVDYDASKCDTKNGWQDLATGVKLRLVWDEYRRDDYGELKAVAIEYYRYK